MRYGQVLDGELIEIAKKTGHRMACCDCGLVHRMNFYIVGKKIRFRAWRDNRATAARRRKKKVAE